MITTLLHHISFIHSNGHDYNKLIDLRIETSEGSLSIYSSFCQEQYKLFRNTCSLCFPLYMNQEDTVDYEQVHWLLSKPTSMFIKTIKCHYVNCLTLRIMMNWSLSSSFHPPKHHHDDTMKAWRTLVILMQR